MTIDIDESKVQRNELGMWLGWTLATAIGMIIGYLPSILLVDVLDLRLAKVIIPLFAGFLVGFAQWWVLKQYLTACSDWIIAGGAGWGAGYFVGLLLINNITGSVFGGLLAYTLFGLIVSLVQWPVLRREIPNVFTWAFANILGWTIGFLLSQVFLKLFDGPTITPVVSISVISGVSGSVAGAITGLALVWIVRQPELT